MKTVSLGFIPLIDAAPLIVAAEFGFAAEEGLAFDLVPAASWSMLRDMLDFGKVEAAQMLSVVPVARSLGLGGGHQPLETALVLSMNGQITGLSAPCAARLGDVPFADPFAMGRALMGLGQPLRIGVPFPFSMHVELLHYWLAKAAPNLRYELRTIPPPRMAEMVLAGEIDGFSVGEPWGSHAVDVAGARLLMPGAAIWSQAPEKVLAMRSGWADENPDVAGRLLRAVWRATRWTADPANRTTLSEVLARSSYLDVSAELIERALKGRLLVAPSGQEADVPGFLTFFDGSASFPWRSQAAWIGTRLAERFALPIERSAEAARKTFRSDLFRRHLAGVGAALPRASEKAEGAMPQSERVSSAAGQLILNRNRFFDGQIFDPVPAI